MVSGNVPICAARETVTIPHQYAIILPPMFFRDIDISKYRDTEGNKRAEATIAVVAAKDSWKLTLKRSSGRTMRMMKAAAAMVFSENGRL